ncbi:hypothetical protein B1H10_06775 [candidate division KSB1 bacterium 4484_188]|nr:MAG: hypothetical protein B1H10_06775 [candidate division KSB1 bacterium 4484_188]
MGVAGAGNLTLRGLGGKPNSQVLVLINGRPDFMGIFGHPLPDVYGLDGIEKIEVVKGPSSAVFGSNAIAGVVNLITSSPTRNQVLFSARAGNYNTYLQRTSLNLQTGQTNFRLGLSHQSSSGHIPLTGFEGWNLQARVDRAISPAWKLSIDGRYTPYRFDDPAMGKDVAKLGYYGDIRRGMADIQLKGKWRKLHNSFHLYSNLGHHRFFDGFESHDFTYGLSSYQNMNFNTKTQIGFGVDAVSYGGKAKNVVFPQAPPERSLHTVNSFRGYLVGFYSPVSQFTIKGGLGYQYTSLKIQKLTPTVGFSYLPLHNIKFFASLNRGFRLPTLQELYLFPVSNARLEPEEVKTVEGGTIIYISGKNFFKATYFRNHIQNRIQLIANPAAPPPQLFRNSGEADQWGAEFLLNAQLLPSLRSQISYSYLDPGNLLAFNPRNMIKYFINYRYRSLTLSVFGKYLTGLYQSNSPDSRLDDYHLVNLAIAYPVGYFTFDLQLRNLLNAKYRVLQDYPAPGFTFLAGFTLRRPWQ